jgi:hypothetical protein
MSDGIPGLLVAQVLGDLRVPALPEGSAADGLLAFVRLVEPDGSIGWAVRVTSNMNDEEVLGVLVGYVEHLKREAADSWDSTDPTRADG